MSDKKFAWLLVVALFCLVGCNQQKLKTEYGKISGTQGSTSLNGVSVLADMFAQRGFTVKRRKKISPRIEKFDTLVWFPDDYSCPSEDAVNALNLWLENGYVRTLIYVGRDYNSQADYLSDVADTAPIEQREELLRHMAEAQLGQDTEFNDYDYYWSEGDLKSCEWFEQETIFRRKATAISGPMSNQIQANKAEVELRTILIPNPKNSSENAKWNAIPLLDADQQHFVFQLGNRLDDYSENKIIVVSNGSFLLNYPLVNTEHRKLAGMLIDSCNEYGDVLFLESGPRGIEVSDTDTINHNAWAWIAQPPLRYIVPHFLMWGVLFCFVFFPIFGRPKILKKRNISTFRNHVNAIGKLISRSDLPNRAVNKIRKYQHTISGESRHLDDK